MKSVRNRCGHGDTIHSIPDMSTTFRRQIGPVTLALRIAYMGIAVGIIAAVMLGATPTPAVPGTDCNRGPRSPRVIADTIRQHGRRRTGCAIFLPAGVPVHVLLFGNGGLIRTSHRCEQIISRLADGLVVSYVISRFGSTPDFSRRRASGFQSTFAIVVMLEVCFRFRQTVCTWPLFVHSGRSTSLSQCSPPRHHGAGGDRRLVGATALGPGRWRYCAGFVVAFCPTCPPSSPVIFFLLRVLTVRHCIIVH